MVTANFDCLKDRGVIRMEVKGHAGFAEMGKDPVCAGASVLAMTVAQCIQSMHEGGQMAKRPNVMIRNGRVLVVAKPRPEHFAEALHVFYVGETGMRLLEQSYPGSVEVLPFII